MIRPRAMLMAGVLAALIPATAGAQLTGRAADLYQQALHSRHVNAPIPDAQILPTTDGQSFLLVWKATPKPARWLVTIHGTGGFATDDLSLWFQRVKDHDVGVVSLQWWRGTVGPGAYFTPAQVYREIDAALKTLDVQPGTAMLHGFSRGSANVYAVAALDAGRGGQKYFSLFVASSGGVALEFPPTRAILNGDMGPRPLAGTRWITAAGGRDPNPDRDGVAGMRRTAAWLKEQGAIVLESIEDPNGGHGALQTNPKNVKHVLDVFAASSR